MMIHYKIVFTTLFFCVYLHAQLGFAAPPATAGYNPERSAEILEPSGPSILAQADGEIQLATSFKVIDYYSFEVALQSTRQFLPSGFAIRKRLRVARKNR